MNKTFIFASLLAVFFSGCKTAENLGKESSFTKGRFNVIDFGAKGDGKTNDTKAVQAAFDKAKSEMNGGVVYFPSGTFLVSKTIDCGYEYPKSIKITGEGTRQTVIKYMGNGVLFNVKSPSKKHSGFIDGFVMKDLSLIGPGVKKQGTIGLKTINFETPFIISNCRFEQWGEWAICLGKFVMEGSVKDCAFNTNYRGILFNGYNDRVVMESCSFWRHTKESVKICSSRVRIIHCFFGKSSPAIILGKGPLQSAKYCSINFCDFEGQRDSSCFIRIGDDSDPEKTIYSGMKFLHCRFGVNYKAKEKGLSGEDLIKSNSGKVYDIPTCFLVKRAISETYIQDCKFANLKKYIVAGSLSKLQKSWSKYNRFENNIVENWWDAKAVPFENGYQGIFEFTSGNRPGVKN